MSMTMMMMMMMMTMMMIWVSLDVMQCLILIQMCGRFVLISVPIISPHCPQTTLTPPSFYCATVRHKYKNTLYYPYHPHSSYQCIASLLYHTGIIMKRRNRHYKFPLFHIAKFFLNSSLLVPIANICHGCRDQRRCTFLQGERKMLAQVFWPCFG